MRSFKVHRDTSLLPHVGDTVEYYYRGENNVAAVEEIVFIGEEPYARISPSKNKMVLIVCADMEKTRSGWIVEEENTISKR